VIIVVVCRPENAQDLRKEEMKLSLPPKLVGKTSLSPSYFVL
jgi:hypothetical protein